MYSHYDLVNIPSELKGVLNGNNKRMHGAYGSFS